MALSFVIRKKEHCYEGNEKPIDEKFVQTAAPRGCPS